MSPSSEVFEGTSEGFDIEERAVKIAVTAAQSCQRLWRPISDDLSKCRAVLGDEQVEVGGVEEGWRLGKVVGLKSRRVCVEAQAAFFLGYSRDHGPCISKLPSF